MAVFGSITFPIHQKKPCQVDWQKLVLPVKIDLVEEKFSQKSLVAPEFDYPDLRNAMTPLMTPLAACDVSDGINGVT